MTDTEPVAKQDYVRIWLALCRLELAEAVARKRAGNHRGRGPGRLASAPA